MLLDDRIDLNRPFHLMNPLMCLVVAPTVVVVGLVSMLDDRMGAIACVVGCDLRFCICVGILVYLGESMEAVVVMNVLLVRASS